jgi:hypothetical protein
MSSADPRLRALLKLAPVIPVYTPEDVNEAVDVAQALFRGGLPVIEVTLRTPQALDAIKAMVEAVPDAVIGAGTVLNAAQMQAAKQAGARFAVSPGATPTLYAAARDADLPYLPGAATASDLILGWSTARTRSSSSRRCRPAVPRCWPPGTARSPTCASARPAASAHRPHRSSCTCPTCCAWAVRG